MQFLLSWLPLPNSILQSCLKAGFRYYEDFFDPSGEWLEEASKILVAYDWSRERVESLLTPISSSAYNLLQEETRAVSIATFCEAMDELLGGGVFLGSLLQVVGSPGSGKTQLLMQLCVDVQLTEAFGGVSKEAVFIDSESAFSVSRLREMCSGAYEHCLKVAASCNIKEDVKDLTVDDLISGVHYTSINGNPTDLARCLVLLDDFISSNPKVGLVVLDSFTMCFLSVTKTLDRTRMIARAIAELRRIAETHNIAVVVANDLTTRIRENGETILVPALGETLSHLMPTTLFLGAPSLPSSHFTAVMYKSPSLPQASAKFQILTDGIRDLHKGS